MAADLAAHYFLYIRRYAPFRSFGGGFEGDGRGFSTKLGVTSRTVGVVSFERRAGSSPTGAGYSSGSSWVGPWEVRRSVPTGDIGHHVGHVRVNVSSTSASEDEVSFTVHTEGNLPLKDILLHERLSGAIDRVDDKLGSDPRHVQGTPDIDTYVDFKATFSAMALTVEGQVRGDGFPNAEIFLLDRLGQALALFDYRTASGVSRPLYRLFFAGGKHKLGSFRREV